MYQARWLGVYFGVIPLELTRIELKQKMYGLNIYDLSDIIYLSPDWIHNIVYKKNVKNGAKIKLYLRLKKHEKQIIDFATSIGKYCPLNNN